MGQPKPVNSNVTWKCNFLSWIENRVERYFGVDAVNGLLMALMCPDHQAIFIFDLCFSYSYMVFLTCYMILFWTIVMGEYWSRIESIQIWIYIYIWFHTAMLICICLIRIQTFSSTQMAILKIAVNFSYVLLYEKTILLKINSFHLIWFQIKWCCTLFALVRLVGKTGSNTVWSLSPSSIQGLGWT